MEQVEENLTLM